MNYLFSIALFTLTGFFSHAQLDPAFIGYLNEKGMQREHRAYLSGEKASRSSADSVHFYSAKYFLKYYSATNFFHHFKQSSAIFYSDTLTFNYTTALILGKDFQVVDNWFGLIDSSARSANVRSMALFYQASVKPRSFDARLLPEELQKDFADYKRYNKRKPFVAGLLSAAVPGLGKLYAGRKRSFLFTLVSQSIFAARTFESVRRLGVRHPFSIFNLAFTGVFYASNIYGSYFDLKRVKAEKRKQFLLHASDYSIQHYCPDQP